MEVKVTHFVGFLTYSILLVITFGLIINGPFFDYIKNENRYIQTYQKINDIDMQLKWPDLILCKSSKIKNVKKHADFLEGNYKNQSEFDNLLKDVFYTEAKEFVYAIGIGSTYDLALRRAKVISVEAPYVKSVLVDVIYNGYCAQIQFEALRSFMISQGDIEKSEADSAFYALMWFQVFFVLLYLKLSN